MIIDITGVLLVPGNCGKACPGNGKFINPYGSIVECCCDECDYAICYLPEHNAEDCKSCTDKYCPNAG